MIKKVSTRVDWKERQLEGVVDGMKWDYLLSGDDFGVDKGPSTTRGNSLSTVENNHYLAWIVDSQYLSCWLASIHRCWPAGWPVVVELDTKKRAFRASLISHKSPRLALQWSLGAMGWHCRHVGHRPIATSWVCIGGFGTRFWPECTFSNGPWKDIYGICARKVKREIKLFDQKLSTEGFMIPSHDYFRTYCARVWLYTHQNAIFARWKVPSFSCE